MRTLIQLTIFSIFIMCGHADLFADDRKPNFLIVLADDVGWDAFGCTGSSHARTPHIDKLAEESIVMDRLYGSVSQCAPIRAELYTGLLPNNNGVLGNAVKEKRTGVLNIADHLAPLGYRVGLTGKSHFSLGKKKINNIKGFPVGANNDIAEYDLSGVRSYIQAAQSTDSPFCVIIGSVHAHHPWTVGEESHFPHDKLELPPQYVDTPATRKAVATHAAEVEQFDQQVGDARALIQEMKLEENTVLIVLSEQGIAMPRGKWSPYEHGSRALCVAHWPEKFTPKRTSAIAMYCDFVPTFVDLAGGQLEKPLDGKSLKPLWLGESEKHRESAFISNVDPFWQKAIVTDQYKLIWTGSPEEDHLIYLFNSPKKFFAQPWAEWNELAQEDTAAMAIVQHVLHPKAYELYDIQKDPYEMNNLAEDSEYQELKMGLLAELKALMTDAGESLEPKKPATKEKRAKKRP